MKILVADDDHVSRKVLQRVLEMHGHEVLLAADGEAALDVVRSQALDLAMLDIRMPRLSGAEVIRQIRTGPPQTRNLPIIAVTACAMKRDREELIRIGASAYCSKPYLIKDILAAIAAVGGQKGTRTP